MASFSPAPVQTVTLAATAVSSRVALASSGSQYEIQNKSNSNWLYVEFGNSSVTAILPNGATPGSYALGPGQSKLVSIGSSATNVAAICDAGLTATLIVSTGYGDS